MEEKCDIPDIPYYTTDIEHPKDWKKPISDALKKGVALEEILVIGDSLSSDIQPSIEEGVEHLIWIDRIGERNREASSLSDLDKVMVVNALEEIWDLV